MMVRCDGYSEFRKGMKSPLEDEDVLKMHPIRLVSRVAPGFFQPVGRTAVLDANGNSRQMCLEQCITGA